MSVHFACSLCGEDGDVDNGRFTVAEAGWDRVKIIRWSPETPATSGLSACCSEHATRLAGQWLVTGNLISPFARAVLGESPMESLDSLGHAGDIVCELAVHRDSVERLLEESPEFLDTMLKALSHALGGGHMSSHQVSDLEQDDMVNAMAAD